MPNPSPPTLERAAGSLALLVMLILLALTIGTPADAALTQPIIIVATPALDTGPLPLAPRLQAPARRVPPDTIEAPAAAPAREAPAPAAPPMPEQQAPVVLVAQPAAPPAAPEAAPATAAIRPSQRVVDPDGNIRLPGVDDWMANLPPEPTATPRPTATGPLPPRTGCVARRGCP